MKNLIYNKKFRWLYPYLVKREILKEQKRFPIPHKRFGIEEVFVKDYIQEFQKIFKNGPPAELLLWSFIRTYKPKLTIEWGTKGYALPLLTQALELNQNEGKILHFKENHSESIAKIYSEFANQPVAFFIEKCKTKQVELLSFVSKSMCFFENIQFLVFDACHEHSNECFNMKRAKIIDIYDQYFRKKDAHLLIQSDEFYKKYAHLNTAKQTKRFFKLGIIYKTHLKENEGKKLSQD